MLVCVCVFVGSRSGSGLPQEAFVVAASKKEINLQFVCLNAADTEGISKDEREMKRKKKKYGKIAQNVFEPCI